MLLDCRHEGAVDIQDVAVDEAGRVRAEEDGRPPSSATSPQRPIGVRLATQALNSASFTSASLSSVLKYPGAMPLTLIPCRAHLHARSRVNEMTPPFVVL